jgi:hypothetical protein
MNLTDEEKRRRLDAGIYELEQLGLVRVAGVKANGALIIEMTEAGKAALGDVDLPGVDT